MPVPVTPPCVTVKVTPLLDNPFTVTSTLPVVAAAGTGTLMVVSLQLEGAVAAPLKVTVLVPWLDPKFVPVIVIMLPTMPELGDTLAITGGGGHAQCCGTAGGACTGRDSGGALRKSPGRAGVIGVVVDGRDQGG